MLDRLYHHCESCAKTNQIRVDQRMHAKPRRHRQSYSYGQSIEFEGVFVHTCKKTSFFSLETGVRHFIPSDDCFNCL